MAFAFGGTQIFSVAAAETAEPARSVKKAVRTVLWRILVFYIGAIFVIAAVVPVGSAGLKSPFAAVLDAAGMPSAATAITLVAVAALLSAWNANLYGASRMTYSLAERGEAPRWLASVSKSRVPVAVVLANVAFGVVTVMLELAFPEKVLPVLLNIVGSTSLIWAASSAIVVIYNDAAYGAEIHHYGSQGLTEKPMLIPELEFSGFAQALGAESAIIRSLSDLSALDDWIDAAAKGTFVADCRITSSVRAPWMSEWMNANRAATAAVAGQLPTAVVRRYQACQLIAFRMKDAMR